MVKCHTYVQWFFFADVSIRSPSKVLMSTIERSIYRIKLPHKYSMHFYKESLGDTVLTALPTWSFGPCLSEFRTLSLANCFPLIVCGFNKGFGPCLSWISLADWFLLILWWFRLLWSVSFDSECDKVCVDSECYRALSRDVSLPNYMKTSWDTLILWIW